MACCTLEIKKTAAPGRDAVAGMLSLHGLGTPLGPGAVVCIVSQATALSREPQVIAWPAGWL